MVALVVGAEILSPAPPAVGGGGRWLLWRWWWQVADGYDLVAAAAAPTMIGATHPGHQATIWSAMW